MQMKLYFTPKFALFTSDFVSKKTIYPIESAIVFKVNVYAKWLPMLKLETFLVWSKLD